MMTKRFVLIGGLLSILGGCDLIEHRQFHDTVLKLQKEDYEKITKAPLCQKPILSFRPQCFSASKTPSLTCAMRKEVSLTLQESVPLKSVFMELSRQVGVGIGLSSDVGYGTEGIFYRAHKMPFIEVIRDICSLTDHRFQIQGSRILIEPDKPYFVTYNIQFLSNSRKSENRISVSTDVFSPLETQKRADNGSNSILAATTLVDFWAELEQNIKMILSSPTLEGQRYTFHKQAGLVSVVATSKQHEQISDYLKKLQQTTLAQVTIEAKIIEVTLDNAYKTGINWSQLGGDVHVMAPLGALAGTQIARDVFTFAVDHEKFSAVLNLVKKFGTVRILSNPRLTVMNNQPAMLKVATNEVFFHLEFERFFQAEGKPDIENISSDAMTVPIGLVMVVQPSINLQTGEITMTLRPTISRVQKEVEDPAVSIKSHQKVKSTVPVVQVRELDSVLKMRSGQVLVMGGLMEDRSSYATASIPVADSIPFFGEFAKGKDDERKVTELVIFLTAHIVDDPYVGDADARVYNTYTEDPRPLRF